MLTACVCGTPWAPRLKKYLIDSLWAHASLQLLPLADLTSLKWIYPLLSAPGAVVKGACESYLVPAIAPEALVVPRHDLARHQHIGLIATLEPDWVGLGTGEPLLVVCGPAARSSSVVASAVQRCTLAPFKAVVYDSLCGQSMVLLPQRDAIFVPSDAHLWPTG